MTAPLPTTDAWEPDAERAIKTFIDNAVAEGFVVTRLEVHQGADHRVYVHCVSGIREGNGTNGTNHQDHVSGDQAP